MKRIMKIAQSNLFELADEACENMKIVEGDIKLADLQGFVAGRRDIEKMLFNAGFEIVIDGDWEAISLDALSDVELLMLAQEADEADSRWHEFENMREQMEREKKEFLYSDECTKGRDLAYIHAWKRAVHFIERFYSEIKDRAEKEREKGPVFTF